MKIVVFDLDETLGYFTEFGIFWECLNNYYKITNNCALNQTNFNHIFDLFPEFIRPNIINILNYLKEQKQKGICYKIMIYTNNNGSKTWVNHIISYFEEKIQFKLFDQIIYAFKINGKIVEISRTTSNKTYHDFIKCTKLPANAEICVLDDTLHNEMIADNVYYINIKPYIYQLPVEYMIKNYKETEKHKIDEQFENFIITDFNKYNYKISKKDPKEYEIDIILGKQILVHLNDFFYKTNKSKTIKKRSIYHKFNKNANKTQRKI